ncbi:MAG: sulfite exporter TauE/SafE family protein [Arenimonas sp.]|nr:sulfite exporter TauE/SafE family protein [Arenimonas sp.]
MPIDFIVLSAAFLSGLLGGVHCTAMCGGIATSLNAHAQQKPFQHALVLNAGRIFSYTFAGLLAGVIGSAFIGLVRIAHLPLILRSVMGLLLMVIALRMFFPKHFAFTQIGNSVLWRALLPLKSRIPTAGYANSFGKGVLWGWLPCGLSTSVLLAAWFEASPLHSSLMMLAFGLGTLPLMTSLSYSGAHFAKLLNNHKIRLSAASFIFMAGLLTALAPWLMQSSTAQQILTALGCRSIV